ncbi:uncharacterized protein AKAME5_001009500 [Lates japonicus]|uniref:Uncharacterized protein n=1 Tax=Lates japonicus TaxID=270547 RepID=A0AAD3R710_LATJO|nr:uncharacterized protein AKAME5_001009500 [Lates japonicus]
MPRGPKARNQTELGTELLLKVKLDEALPNTWLCRKELMEDGKVALLACSLIATEIIKHLKSSVRFVANTKPGDETP